MKGTFSIMLILVLLFNLIGYRLLLSFMEDKANMQLEAQINDNNFDESQLVSLKIPVAYLPYYDGPKSFERIDGEVEIQGVIYKYVKRRICNDTLEILCIPNHKVMKLETTQNEFFKFANDLKQEKKSGSHPSSNKTFSVDSYTTGDPFAIDGLYFIISQISSRYSFNIPSCCMLNLEHPPQHC